MPHFAFAPPPADDILLTSVETAQYLRVSLSTLRRWAKADVGPPPRRLGHRYRYRLSDIRQSTQGEAA